MSTFKWILVFILTVIVICAAGIVVFNLVKLIVSFFKHKIKNKKGLNNDELEDNDGEDNDGDKEESEGDNSSSDGADIWSILLKAKAELLNAYCYNNKFYEVYKTSKSNMLYAVEVAKTDKSVLKALEATSKSLVQNGFDDSPATFYIVIHNSNVAQPYLLMNSAKSAPMIKKDAEKRPIQILYSYEEFVDCLKNGESLVILAKG